MRQALQTKGFGIRYRRCGGFTLLELIVALAVAAILFSIGIPSFLTFIRGNRLTTESTDFMGALALTRNTAAVRGTPVTLGRTGTTGGDFSSGWKVWVDPNANGVLDAGEEVVRIYGPLSGDTLVNTEGANAVTYLSTGFVSAAAGTTLHFKLCGPQAGSQGRQITISPAGTPHVSNIGC